MKKLLSIVLALVLVLSIAAAAETVVIGCTIVPHADILEAAKPILAAQGIDLDIVIFDDYVQPNLQLDAGDLDANYFQHVPYLNSFNASYGTTLVPIAGVHYEPMGIYAGKASSLEDLKAGVTIGIPDDPSNELRALELLAALGYITLPEGYDTTITAMDIKGDLNPLKLDLVEVAAEQLPRQLQDFDFAIINSNYALAAGPEVVGTALVTEAEDVAYPNVLVVRAADTEKEVFKAIIEVLQSEDIVKFIADTFGTAVVPTTEF